jgi:hypothetical protein
MTDDTQIKGQAPQMGAERGVVTVGLVATPPDHPARVAERLTRELPDLLSARVDRDCAGRSARDGVRSPHAATAVRTRCSTTSPGVGRDAGGTSPSA